MFPLTTVIGLLAGAGVVSGQRYKHVSTIHQGNYMDKFLMEGSEENKYTPIAWNHTDFVKNDYFGVSFESFRNWAAKADDQDSPAYLKMVSKNAYQRGLFMVTINHSNTEQCAVHQSVYLFNGDTRIYAPVRGPKFSWHQLRSDLGTESCTINETAGTFRRCESKKCKSSYKNNVDVEGPMVYTFLVDESGVRTWVWPKANEPQNFAKERVDIDKFGPPVMHILRKDDERKTKCGAVAKLDNVRLAIAASLCEKPLADECPNYQDTASCRNAILLRHGSSRDLLKGIKFSVDRVDIWKVDEKANKCKPTDPTKIFNNNNNGISIKKDHKRPECKPKRVKPAKGNGNGDNQVGYNNQAGSSNNQAGVAGGDEIKPNNNQTGVAGGEEVKPNNNQTAVAGGDQVKPSNNQTAVAGGDQIMPNKTGTYVTRYITRYQTSKCPTPTPVNCTDKVVTVHETEISPVITPQVTAFFKTVTVPCPDAPAVTTCTSLEKWYSSVEGVPAVPAAAATSIFNYYCVCPPQDPNCPNKGKVLPVTVPVKSKEPGNNATFHVTKTLCRTDTYTVTCTKKVPGCTDGAVATNEVPTAVEVSPVVTPTTVTVTVPCAKKPTCTDTVKVLCLACVGGAQPPAKEVNGTSGSGSQLPSPETKPLGPVDVKNNATDSGVEGPAKGKETKPEGGVEGSAKGKETKPEGGVESTTNPKETKPEGGVLGDSTKPKLTEEPSEGTGVKGTSSGEDKPITSPKDKSNQGVLGSSSDEEDAPATKEEDAPATKDDESPATNEVAADEAPAKLSLPAPAGKAGQAGAVDDSAAPAVPTVDGSAAAKPVLSLIAVFAAMLLW